MWRERGESPARNLGQGSPHVRRQSDRPARRAHAGDEKLGTDQDLFAAARELDHVQRGAAQFAAAR